MLKKVEITQNDDCFSYALKRVGKYELFGHMEFSKFVDDLTNQKSYDFKALEVGDIIVCFNPDRASCTESNSRTILENGMLLFSSCIRNCHFMVFEDNNLMSDLTYSNASFNFIRMRKCDISMFDGDDFIIKTKLLIQQNPK